MPHKSAGSKFLSSITPKQSAGVKCCLIILVVTSSISSAYGRSPMTKFYDYTQIHNLVQNGGAVDAAGAYTQAVAYALAHAEPPITEINIAMTMYVNPGEYDEYANYIATQIANFEAQGVAVNQIFITEVGLMCDGQPCEELPPSIIGPMLEEMFSALYGVLQPYIESGQLNGITASYFYDSDGDGIPDQTWLVLVTFVDGVAQGAQGALVRHTIHCLDDLFSAHRAHDEQSCYPRIDQAERYNQALQQHQVSVGLLVLAAGNITAVGRLSFLCRRGRPAPLPCGCCQT